MDLPHAAVSPPEAHPRLVQCSRSAFSLSASSPYSTGFSTTSFRKHARRKHVPVIFSELQELPSAFLLSLVKASSTSTLNIQQIHGCRFMPDRALFILRLHEQTQSPGSHIRARASVGRLSGALHGGNSRKHRHRRSNDSVQQDNSYEHNTQHLDRTMSGDEVSNESDSDYQDGSDMAGGGTDDRSSSECTADQPTNLSLYDSIHGGFWMNDPYYQELETQVFREDRQSVGDETVTGSESLLENQGGNGAAFGIQRLNDLNRTTDLQSAQENVNKPIPKVACMLFQEVAGAAEDRQQRIHGLINIGEHGLKKVEIAELSSSNFVFLEESEIDNAKGSRYSGNRGLHEIKAEQRSDVKGALSAVAATFNDSEVDITSVPEDSLVVRTAVSETVESELLAAPTVVETVVEQVGRLVEQVAEIVSDSLTEQVVMVVDKVEKLPEVAEQMILKVVDQVSEVLPDPVVEQVGQVAEQVTQTAEQFVEQVTTHVVEPISTTTSQIVNFLSSDEDDEESDDEFEAYTSLDIPEFKGRQGLGNFTILQEEQGFRAAVYNFYIFMLKRSLLEFFLGMLAAPILLSILFTFLYLPQFNGLAFDESVREFMQNSDSNINAVPEGLQLSWETIFRVFMFSVSLSTGLQPELAPLSPYTLVVANLNALLAQLIFVFLSGAVFARLSQPSLPVKCSTVAIICPPPANRRLRKEVRHKALLTRYVLVGPQPCELVDVKVDLTYHYNTVTRSGTYFRTSQSLKLVRPEIAFLDHGMLVRHIMDETSPLYQRTQGMLEKEDAIFSLCVVGLERSSMQSVFHVQHYCVHDKDVIWDAEFVDMILINKKNQRVVDHSLLSKWRPVIAL